MSLNLPDFPVSPNEAIAKLIDIGPMNLVVRKRESFQAAWSLTGYAGGRVFVAEAAAAQPAAAAVPAAVGDAPVLKQTAKLSREDGFAVLRQIHAEVSAPTSEAQRLQILDKVKIDQLRQLFHWGIDLIADLAKASV